MHASTILVTLAAAVSAHQYAEVAMPGPAIVKRALEARQTGSTGTGSGTGSGSADTCLAGVMSVFTGMPTPPAQIMSFYATASITDPCKLTVPATLSSAYSSYMGAVSSWSKDNSAKINSAMSSCPAASSLAAQATGATCASGGGSGSGSGGSGSSGSTNGGNNDSNPGAAKGSGARANVVASGMAAVGFIGAVVLL